MTTEQQIICEARDTSRPFMTLSISGIGDGSDFSRLRRVLLHLLDSDGEWDGPRPNVRLVQEVEA